ncbi:MAG: dephospho-CoA kinase [Lachnospiraceae bacterium]|nr:dephospho-CoA kinase [Lachnospiraceae bacterium]
MITIGVTGGVGAGKSEILRYLEKNYNCRILMSDNAAKELEAPGGILYEPLVRLLEEKTPENGAHGPLLLENGEIDKQEMAGRIFSDPLLLTRINELVHPAVNKYIHDEIERERISGEKEFFILESALLIENGYDRILDSMWYIYCEESVRSMRLKASRGYSDEKIRSIMMRQVSEEVFRTHCDTVIDNTLDFDGPQGAAIQVDEAVARLREKFGAQQ